MADDELRAKMLGGWVETAARLARAEQPRDLIFETMILVAVAGLLQSRPSEDAAQLLREVADAVEQRQELGHVLHQVGRILRQNGS